MSIKSILFSILYVMFATSPLIAQEVEAELPDDRNHAVPIMGDNFAYGYGSEMAFRVTHYTAEDNGVTTVFLHKGFKSGFGLSLGTATVELNPELIYFTPEYSMPLNDNLTLAFQVRTIYPDNFKDMAISPAVLLSYGSPLKNVTLGYSLLNEGDGYKTMDFGDRIYASATYKISGRIPIIRGLGVYSKNDLLFRSGVRALLSKTGLEYRGWNYSFFLGVNYETVSAPDFFRSDSILNFVLGGSFLF